MRAHGRLGRKIYRSVSAILSQSKGRYSSIFAWGLSPRGSSVWQLRHLPLTGGPASCGWWASSQHNLFGFTSEWQLFKIGSGLHTPLDSFLFHFKSFPWDSLNSSIFLMTNYPSIPLEMKSSFCLATSLFIYFPSSWVYMYVALNGQCIKKPLFIFICIVVNNGYYQAIRAREAPIFPSKTVCTCVCVFMQIGQYVKLSFFISSSGTDGFMSAI